MRTFTFPVAGSAEIEAPAPASGTIFYRMTLEATTLLP